MKKVYTFYENNIRELSGKLDRIRRNIHWIGTLRLLTVIAAACCLWFFRHEGGIFLLTTGIVFLIPFLGLLVLHNRFFRKRDYYEILLQLNRDEKKGLDYDYSAFDGAAEFAAPEHSFASDLDIFGRRSLFQAINRTSTAQGKQCLARWFKHPLTDGDSIRQRQEAIAELAAYPDLCQRFYASGKLDKKKPVDADTAEQLFQSPPVFSGKPVWRLLVWAFPLSWAIAIILVAFHLLPAAVLAWLTTVCFLIVFSQIKKVNRFHRIVGETEKVLRAYSLLMKIVETQNFRSHALQAIVAEFTGHEPKASEAIRRLSVYAGKLDQRYNVLMAFVLNVLFLWDIRQTLHIERWKIQYAPLAKDWFEALGKFDAFGSLATFAFNHPDYIFPSLTAEYFCLKGQALGHPLMNRHSCIKNDIDIEKSPEFLIITGANMAGKSTYLRTVGVNYVLACIGAPVCAAAFTFYPAALVTSLRTTDSLMDNESYFFAELKRLSSIIERLKKGEKLFIVLDEILKGTNSVDKQKGSIALLKQLIFFNTCGIIATHDLVLGTLEDSFPGEIKNYRFEADITDNELTFSYRLRPGIAQNMNACFLMKKMGIGIGDD